MTPRLPLLLIPAVLAASFAAPPLAAEGRMTDAEAAAYAHQALKLQDRAQMKAALQKLKMHVFRLSKVPEREPVLFSIGMLEARLGNRTNAAEALKKLEKGWPDSAYLAEANLVLAEHALDHELPKEAETRLRKALTSDLSAETKRQAQELLLWTLVQEGRPEEGLDLMEVLIPLGQGQNPSERGLAAMVEVLCAADRKGPAEATRKDFQELYPDSPQKGRVELAWARLLGRQKQSQAAANVLRKLIKDVPKGPEADEARLMLATLLTEGKLSGRDKKDLPQAESLLQEMNAKDAKGAQARQAELLQLRIFVEKSLYQEALDHVAAHEEDFQQPDVQREAQALWSRAWNAWVKERLDKGYAGYLLERLNRPGAFPALTPEHRKGVFALLAKQGVMQPLPALLKQMPSDEWETLRRAALEQTTPEAQPRGILNLMPEPSFDDAAAALLRARSEAALGHWEHLRAALGGAQPGAERVQAAVTYLQRPREAKESVAQRLREAEALLARAPEKGPEREPLAIVTADLRAQAGDWRGALALYPPKAGQPPQRGWVALMRAQAHVKLGHRDQAKGILKEARDEQGFKGQRDALAKALGAY